MRRAHVLIFGCFVCCVQGQVTLEVDRPWIRVPVGLPVVLECCYRSNKETVAPTWWRRLQSNSTIGRQVVKASELGTVKKLLSSTSCGTLTLTSVQLRDSGLYQCLLNGTKSHLLTPGTYLQVYEPAQKSLNMSEERKNGILITEGILLLLCVLVPSAALLYKSKQVHELEKKIEMKQQENIYQGLNLDDCCAAYDQIQRSRADDQYQDVGSIAPEEVQFEKP